MKNFLNKNLFYFASAVIGCMVFSLSLYKNITDRSQLKVGSIIQIEQAESHAAVEATETSVQLESVDDRVQSDATADNSWQFGTKEYRDEWCLLDELTPDGVRAYKSARKNYLDGRGNVDYAETGEYEWQRVNNGYESYDILTLKSLGSQGDLEALYHLVERSDSSSDDKQWAFYQSYLHGGTALASNHFIENDYIAATTVKPEEPEESIDVYISNMVESLRKGEEYVVEENQTFDPESLVDAKKILIEGLAWGIFAGELRGDRSVMKIIANLVDSGNEDNYPGQIHQKLYPITEEDIAQARALSREYLVEINAQRQARGIGGELETLEISKLHAWDLSLLAYRIASGEDVDFGLMNDFLVPKTTCFEKQVAWFEALQNRQ